MKALKALRTIAALTAAGFLSGCQFVVLDPSGDVARQQRDLVVIATIFMLLIVVPVMALTVSFAWRYRHSNHNARYEPDWDHSTELELLIWTAPLLIIICLGALTWMGTHLLDPYRTLGRFGDQRPAAEIRPLEVDVVALDWKWLFIYPEYGIAAVNELAAPINRAIDFRITSSSVMNSFYVPALAGQIYAMAGMETKLHAVINQPGTYKGFSANYSGAGFSGMRFDFHGLAAGAFDDWVAHAKAAADELSRAHYLELERPSENVPVRYYAAVDPSLYGAILNMCVTPGKMCLSEMMAVDAKGGLGLAGINNTVPLAYDKYARPSAVFGAPASYVVGVCSIDEIGKAPPPLPAPADGTPLHGAGLPRLDTPLRQMSLFHRHRSGANS
ncbi:MAG TPA: ubiquinol oxidase subunit II [Bradyrhizobium sp.]|nr:ubiquinol oxidase subunit II [Bradyrhizobium sp.]